MTLGMLQKRKTTTTQTRIEKRFKSFFVEPLDLFRDSLKVSALITIIHHYQSIILCYFHPPSLLQELGFASFVVGLCRIELFANRKLLKFVFNTIFYQRLRAKYIPQYWIKDSISTSFKSLEPRVFPNLKKIKLLCLHKIWKGSTMIMKSTPNQVHSYIIYFSCQ